MINLISLATLTIFDSCLVRENKLWEVDTRFLLIEQSDAYIYVLQERTLAEQ